MNPFNAGLESLTIQLICKWSLRPDDLNNLNVLAEQIYELKSLRRLDLHLQSLSVEKQYAFRYLSKFFQEPNLLNEISLKFNFFESLEFRDLLVLLQKTNSALTKFRLSVPIHEVSEESSIFEVFLGDSNSLKTLELPGFDVCSIKSLERIFDLMEVNKNIQRVEIGVIDAAVGKKELSEFLEVYLPRKFQRDVKFFWTFQSRDDITSWLQVVRNRAKEKSRFKTVQYCSLQSREMGISYVWSDQKAEKGSC